MAEDTSKLLPAKGSEGHAAPTLEAKEEEPLDNSHESPSDVLAKLDSSPDKKSNPEEKKLQSVAAAAAVAPPAKKVILMERVQAGKYKAVFRVIKEGKLPANLLLDPQNKWYLIHYLVMHGKLKELKVLVNKFDCDINILDAYQQTPLHMAALHGKTEIFKYLVQHPMVRLDTQDSFRASPLVNYIKSGFLAGFIYLHFEKGADIKVVDSQGFTVVHWAAFKNSVPLLQLFKHIPTLVMDSLDGDGMTPIFRAISGMSYDSVKYLIRVEKANLETRSTRRQTPCELAESMPMHPRVLGYVKKHTEFQKVEKRGPSRYLKDEGWKKGFPWVFQYLLRRYAKTLTISTTLALMMFMLVTFWKLGPAGKLATGLFSGAYLSYVLLFALLLLFRRDPGYQPMKGREHPTNAIAQILEHFRTGSWTNCENYCFSCLTNLASSTHHCLTCGRCVNGFQFHLKSLGVCIGHANFPVYFLYELIGTWAWYIYCGSVLNAALPKAVTGFPVSMVEKWLTLFSKHWFVATVVLALVLISVQKCYELLVMSTAIWKGMTVHELRNMHLYKYLFELKDFGGDQGKRYVHKKRTWGQCCENVAGFVGQAWAALRGVSEISQNQVQYIQLAERARKTEESMVTEVVESPGSMQSPAVASVMTENK